jgi:hypothetical protein
LDISNGQRANRLRIRLSDDLGLALGMGLLAIVVLALVNYRFLSTFALKGDDYALVQHSARFFSPSITDWIGHGYRWYNLTYPELGSSFTNFIRPTLNGVVYLTSWLSPTPRSVVLLVPNYLGHGICVALVFFVARWVFGLSKGASVLASGLFLGSVTIGTDPQVVAYGGDMIAALFSLAALLLLHSHLTREPSPWKIALVGMSLLLALFAKESAAGAPFILAIDVLWVRSRSGRRDPVVGDRSTRLGLVALAIVLPTLLYAAARLAAGLDGLYVVEELPRRIAGIPMVALNPFRFLATAFFPIETGVLKDVVGGASWDLDSVLGVSRAILALALNVIGWILIVRLLRQPPQRTKVAALLGMALMASVVPLIFKAEPRIMYFSQALFIPLFVLGLTDWWAHVSSRERRPRALAQIGIAWLVLIGPAYYLTQQALAQPELVSENRATMRTQEAILAAIGDESVSRLYLVNATSSMSPGLNALRFLAALGDRPDLRLRVVNTFTGEIPSADGLGGVGFSQRGDDLIGTITIGSSQRLFRDLSPEEARRLGQPGIIEYGPILGFHVDSLGKWEYVGRHIMFRIPFASRDDYAIVGLDPSRAGVFVREPTSTG